MAAAAVLAIGGRTITDASTSGVSALAANGAPSTVYVSTAGVDSKCVRGNEAKPCASLNRAFALAQPGDTVFVRCGTYGAQTISGAAKTLPVLFYAETYDQPSSVAEVVAATTCVTVESLDISTSRVHVTGIQATGGDVMNDHASEELSASGALSDVVIDGWHGHQAGMYATGITIRYSKLGDTNFCGAGYNNDEDALRFWMSNAPSDNNRLIRSVIRNWIGPPDGQCGMSNGHNDMFQTPGGNNMVFNGNLFYNGPTSNMQVGEFAGGVIGSLVIRNNYFGPTEGSNNLSIGQGHCDGILIQNNVIAYPAHGMPTNNNGCSGTMTQSNNVYVGSISSCGPSPFSGSYNVFPPGGPGTCGANARRCTPSWVHGAPPSDGSAWTPELSPRDTCLRNRVPTAGGTYPATDIYGTRRPQGAAVEGGPYELPGACKSPCRRQNGRCRAATRPAACPR